MITEALFNLVSIILGGILNFLDELPQFPASLVNSLNQYFDLIFDNLNVLPFFVRISTIKVIIPLLIVVINFERIYAFLMWIVRKIPFVGME